ncbi:MAG: virulence protein SciE type [Gammaproteobacteria bacterium]|nr:virulence protein SciE type [Gammaproteobacteria bacterium]
MCARIHHNLTAGNNVLAIENLREADLAGSLSELQQTVRAEPSEARHRIFLFQLLTLTGDWERAVTQLKVLGEMDPATLPMVQTYREALRCEVYRQEVFAGKRTPLVFGDPEMWVAKLVQALSHGAQQHFSQAIDLRSEAFDEAPATAGSINGTPFEWIADADPRLGPVLEMIVNGNYYWVPVHRVGQIEFEAPSDLRDFVWTPATVTWANGGESVALMPTRYPNSHEDKYDDRIRLARMTDWEDLTEDYFVGLGQRLFTTDSGDHALLDTRKLILASAAVGEETAQDSPGDA